MLAWMRRSMRKSHGRMGAAFGALADVLSPGAARARESLRADNQRVMPIPSPGDKLLRDGKIIIGLPSE